MLLGGRVGHGATLGGFHGERLLDQMRDRLRYLHCSLRTEPASVYWLRQYVLRSGKRHPSGMGRGEVGAVLTRNRLSMD
jgi:hypothetical protein